MPCVPRPCARCEIAACDRQRVGADTGEPPRWDEHTSVLQTEHCLKQAINRGLALTQPGFTWRTWCVPASPARRGGCCLVPPMCSRPRAQPGCIGRAAGLQRPKFRAASQLFAEFWVFLGDGGDFHVGTTAQIVDGGLLSPSGCVDVCDVRAGVSMASPVAFFEGLNETCQVTRGHNVILISKPFHGGFAAPPLGWGQRPARAGLPQSRWTC